MGLQLVEKVKNNQLKDQLKKVLDVVTITINEKIGQISEGVKEMEKPIKKTIKEELKKRKSEVKKVKEAFKKIVAHKNEVKKEKVQAFGTDLEYMQHKAAQRIKTAINVK